MRLLLVLIGAVLILSSGCAGSNHYYKEVEEQLHIYLKYPEAEKVHFFSSLDQFQPHEALKNEKGVWDISVPSGQEITYFYIVDGEIFTPECELMAIDDLGGKNCIYLPGL